MRLTQHPGCNKLGTKQRASPCPGPCASPVKRVLVACSSKHPVLDWKEPTFARKVLAASRDTVVKRRTVSTRCTSSNNVTPTALSKEEVDTICTELLGQVVDSLPGNRWVMAQPVEVLKARLKEHVELFGAQLQLTWLQQCPEILSVPTEELVNRLEGLGKLIGLPGPFVAALTAQDPSVLTAEPGTVQQNCTELQELFSLSELDTARIITTCPSILLLRGKEIRRNLTSLSSSLAVDSDAIVRAAPYLPQLMLLSPERFQQKLAQLMQGLRMDATKVRGILAAGPRLVAMPAEVVVAEWDALCALVAEEEAWLNQLVTLPAAIIASCLTSDEFKQRMRFFKETGQIRVRYINLVSILKQENLDFAQKYKGYVRWLADQSQPADEQGAEQQQQPAAAAAS